MSIHVGISGWVYDDWRGSFYPEGLKQKDELTYASARLGSIEINGTFYRLQKPATFQSWRAQTPAGFPLALKSPKIITHERRLKDVAMPLANFMASGILALGDKLGPILWQFPPSLAFDPERFAPFMAALPADTFAAAELGRGHSDWMAERAFLTPDAKRPMRHAFEVRNHSFKTPAFVELAKRHGIAIVVGDTAGRWPYLEEDTSDFYYVRLHGDEVLFPDGYTQDALFTWADKLRAWEATGKSVFAYFDNDTKTSAPFDALNMIKRLEQLMGPRETPRFLPPAVERTGEAAAKPKTRAKRAPKVEAAQDAAPKAAPTSAMKAKPARKPREKAPAKTQRKKRSEVPA